MTDIEKQLNTLLKLISDFIEKEEIEEEIREDLVLLIEQVKLNPTKENLQVLSKVLSSFSDANLAEMTLNLAGLTD